jgi:hypothetical protein
MFTKFSPQKPKAHYEEHHHVTFSPEVPNVQQAVEECPSS